MTPKKTLSQKEADDLLNMIKRTLSESVEFPSKGNSLEFDLIGDTKKELFTAKIYRGRINSCLLYTSDAADE